MANLFQFDENQPKRTPLCGACEELLADALDQTLSPTDQAWFEQHTATCADCSAMLADAQRGAAWLEILKTPRPEPSALLMERILAQTSGLQGDGLERLGPVVVGQPAMLPVAMPPANVLAFRPRMPRMPKFSGWTNARFEPRLAMTAAMAFFSIALTLNLSGVRLDQLHASSLNPANLKRTYYEANAGAVRYYDNLSVVRVMESRVDTLRDASEDRPEPKANPEMKPEDRKPTEQKKPGGMSERTSPPDRPRVVLTSGTQVNTGNEEGVSFERYQSTGPEHQRADTSCILPELRQAPER